MGDIFASFGYKLVRDLCHLLGEDHLKVKEAQKTLSTIEKEIRHSKGKTAAITSSTLVGNVGEYLALLAYADRTRDMLKQQSLSDRKVDDVLRQSIVHSSNLHGFDIIDFMLLDDHWAISLVESKFVNDPSNPGGSYIDSGTYQNNLDFVIKFQQLADRLEQLCKKYGITDPYDDRLNSLLDQLEDSLHDNLTLAKLMDNTPKGLLIQITSNGTSLQCSNLSIDDIRSYQKLNRKLYSDSSRIWPDIADDTGDVDETKLMRYHMNRGDPGKHNQTLHVKQDEKWIQVTRQVETDDGMEELVVPTLRQRRTFNVSISEDGSDAEYIYQNGAKQTQIVEVDICRVDLTNEEFNHLIEQNTDHPAFPQPGVIYLTNDYIGQAGSITSRLALELLDKDLKLTTVDNKRIAFDSEFDVVKALLLGMFANIHHSDLRKITVLSTTAQKDWGDTNYQQTYKHNTTYKITEELFFRYGGQTDFIPTLRQFHHELIRDLRLNLEHLGIPEEQIVYIEDSIDNNLAHGNLNSLIRGHVRYTLNSYLEVIENRIDEIADRPALKPQRVAHKSRFVKPTTGDTPPEGILVTKSKEFAKSGMRKQYLGKDRHFIQHYYIDDTNNVVYRPVKRDNGLYYHPVKLFINENGVIKLNWEGLYPINSDVTEYLIDIEGLSTEAAEKIEYSDLTPDQKRKLLKYFGKYSPPKEYTRIELFYLLDFKNRIQHMIKCLTSGLYDEEIDDFTKMVRNKMNLNQEAYLVDSALNNFYRSIEDISLDVNIPVELSRIDIIKAEVLKVLFHLSERDDPVSIETLKNMYIYKILTYGLEFTKYRDTEPLKYRRGLFKDFLKVKEKTINQINAALGYSLINYYNPNTDFAIEYRKFFSKDDNFSKINTFMFRIFALSLNDYRNNKIFTKKDPFKTFLRTKYPNEDTSDRERYHLLLSEIQSSLETWIRKNREKYDDNTYFDWKANEKVFIKKSLRFAFQSNEPLPQLEKQLTKIKYQIETAKQIDTVRMKDLSSGDSECVDPTVLLKYLLRY